MKKQSANKAIESLTPGPEKVHWANWLLKWEAKGNVASAGKSANVPSRTTSFLALSVARANWADSSQVLVICVEGRLAFILHCTGRASTRRHNSRRLQLGLRSRRLGESFSPANGRQTINHQININLSTLICRMKRIFWLCGAINLTDSYSFIICIYHICVLNYIYSVSASQADWRSP